MKIEYEKVSKLIPYADNPRRNAKAVTPVANSIREFGFKVPIVVDEGGVIITGHTRLAAALDLGLDEVPVIRANDLTPQKVREFRLADNKTAELASWDWDKLEDELEWLYDKGADMEMFGFSAPEDDIGFDNWFEAVGGDRKLVESVMCPHCGSLIDISEVGE